MRADRSIPRAHAHGHRLLARRAVRMVVLVCIFLMASMAGSVLASSQAWGADWELWLSPDPTAEVLDQSQLVQDPGFRSAEVGSPTIKVGQTFVPRKASLHRIDFRFDNADDDRPGRIRIYRWKGAHRSTTGGKPIFDDVIDFSGSDGFRTHSFFPRKVVQPGALYYVEFTVARRTPYRVAQARAKEDPYPQGQAFRHGKAKSGKSKRDLWFRTFARASAGDVGTIEERAIQAAGESSKAASTLRFASDARAPWFPPRTWLKPITREHYLERIKSFADRFRIYLVSECSERLYGNAMREAFLYRVSCESGECEERRIADAMVFLRRGHAWQFCSASTPGGDGVCEKECNPKAPIGFDDLDRPAMAYRWLRDSPTLTPEDHALVRELLLDRARRLWPNREHGAHNRAMTAALGYRLVADLFPDAREAASWRAYARDNWNAFWAARDTYEDSAHYNTVVWWPAILRYMQVAGLEEKVWKDERFLALVDRFAATTLPLGVMPNYGDSVGLPDPSGLTWLFEEAATHTRQPEYRWLAHRLFSYAKNRVRDEWPRRDMLYASHPSLMGAYSAADETLEPRRPKDREEVLSASHRPAERIERRVDPGHAASTVFVPESTPLVRVALGIRNLNDERPAQITLWRWQGDRKKTLAKPPLYRDSLEMSGVDLLMPKSVEPFLSVDAGKPYYIEVERSEAPFSIEADASAANKISFDVYTLNGSGSVVTQRAYASRIRKEDRERQRKKYAFSGKTMPDKLVLRSGHDPGDMHAVFNLVAGQQHGQSEVGALISLVDAGSVLFTSGSFPYWFFGHVRAPQDESLPFVRRHWGGRYGRPGTGATVTHFADSRGVSVATLEFKDPNGWQIRQQRKIFFVKNRFMLIRDRFEVPSDMTVSMGPVWHARDLGAEAGEHFFDLYNRQPLSNIWRVRNPARHALVYFVPHSDREVDAVEVSAYLPPSRCVRDSADSVDEDCRGGPTFAAFQRWSGRAKPGESRVFDTLIVPHRPQVAVGTVAAGVRELTKTGDAIALEVLLGDERWLVVDNPKRGRIQVPDLETDARYAVARTAEGVPIYLRTDRASRMRWAEIERSWSVRTSVEVGGESPVRRLKRW